MPMRAVHEFYQRVITAADRNGWEVIEIEPGFVRLRDSYGLDLELRTDTSGIAINGHMNHDDRLLAYVQQIKRLGSTFDLSD